MYKLTEEGRKYLKEGLPEKNLLKLLPASIKEIQEKLPESNIAIGQAKKKGWIKIEKGEIHLTLEGKKVDKTPLEERGIEEKSLKDIEDGKTPSEKILKELLKRNLVEEIREDIVKKAEKQIDKEITNLTPELIKTGLWRKVKLKEYNVEALGERIYPGKKQPYRQFLEEVKKKLIAMGFKEMEGPLIETEFWNFDALFQPQDHPARDWTDTYQLKEPKYGKLPKKLVWEKVKEFHENGWKYKWSPKKAARLMPRAHVTAVSARTLLKAEIPGKYFFIARCFRPDVLDATHLIEFDQIEGIVLDEALTFRSLLGILEIFAKEVAGATEIKFYPDYYPFTEPSVQLSAKHPKLGWVEFGGAGVFREEVTKPLGINVPVIAWGLGIGRLAMFKLGVHDIRYLFSDDLKWLREVKVV